MAKMSNTLKLQHTTYTDLEVNMRKMLLLINLSRQEGN